jgi:hypothetical protein
VYFELERFDLATLPAEIELNGVRCRLLSGGALADTVDIPTLPGLVADGYLVIMLTGIREDDETVDVIYSLSGFYRALSNGIVEILSSTFSEPPMAAGTLSDGALRLTVVAAATKGSTSIEMFFAENVTHEISPTWRAMVASQWPKADSRDVTSESNVRFSAVERAWRSSIVR